MGASAVAAPATSAATAVPGGVIAVIRTDGAPGTISGPPLQSTQVAPVTTDAGGRFVFRNMDPGNYLLRVSADGYALQEYNARPGAASDISRQVKSADGQSLKDVVFRLVPGGTVSGRITGPNGEALVNIEVSLLRNRYGPDGRKTLQQAGSATTNDRGEYRMFWITPGRYYLTAGSTNRPIPGVAFNPLSPRNKYQRTFYPSTTDVATATPIDVQPAVELSGLDFRLNAQATFRVRGRVIDPTSGQVPRFASVSISLRDPGVNTGFASSGNNYNAGDGSFELRDVPSGSYLVRAQVALNSGNVQPGQPPPPPPTATAFVDVAAADVDGIVLTLVPPTFISGRIRIEGEPLPQLFRASVNLNPGVIPSFGPPPRPAQASPDGTFILDGVLPGEYRVNAVPQFGASGINLYVKEIRFGSTDVLSNLMVVSGQTSDTLEIVFGKDAGKISGTGRVDSQQLTSGVQVVLVPNERTRQDRYKSGGTGPN